MFARPFSEPTLSPPVSRLRLLALPLAALLWLGQPILGIAGLVHAVGHVLVARRMGLAPLLSLGTGPALWEHRSGRYRVSLLPGAFCRAELEGLPPVGAFAVLAGGPVANLLMATVLPVLLLTAAASQGELVPVEPTPEEAVFLEHIVVDEVMTGMAAAEAGLRPGDRVESVDGVPLDDFAALVERTQSGEAMVLGIERDGGELELQVQPGWQEGGERYVLGFTRVVPEERVEIREVGLGEAVGKGVSETGEIWRTLSGTLADTLDATPAVETIGGPVEMAALAPPRHAHPSVPFLRLVALTLISGNLGLFLYNLLPLPWSDTLRGLVELNARRTGRRPPVRWENAVGVALIGTLGLLVVVFDVIRWTSG